ncbi:MAG: undecaprenyldiphospho-muramoylpentapeptide beta-N-acetylglucosaminyltransferase [Alphaproteobacteria bacterium RIFCSPHIGHO2_01_FULL_41_14]|nr:MAG: undecaprenyldiphospho-muramoylpentapeptide beta-N-acetylglucosaminyltransferase [Alphaproteobacteria bacterium GWB1_45_5]OFW76608.1 MAG: undecaprenyldiphospho-muramoylpentapeptide beta-N-acetylglucosaminyltransferase [Alphaproteobacteria bacterium GWA1_45_9]OFW89692.1 MAG: undecaprenyldiphospho-muramoylpentapeptide beta-N-acetylglucosaminyltransferase [Alphaproteobacteria bacterium RIFCSPHIGHO2_01_FULL_41_14]HCI49135.1 undecaprenyldiphospho-muramoylpentapeptide beta-N-acetylglucosaminylt
MIKGFKKIKRPFITVVGGGTGGHIFPAQALAEKLKQRGHRVLYITDKRGMGFHTQPKDIPFFVLDLPYYRPGLIAKLALFVRLTIEIFYVTWRFLLKRPALVVGFGGYPSFPPLVAALVLRVPFIMHEQNAYVGRVTRWLAPFSQKITSVFSSINGLHPQDSQKIVVTGNPIRANIAALRTARYKAPTKTIRLFVVGGSQGAKAFSIILPLAIRLLPPLLKKRLKIIQQCRPEFEKETRALYKEGGLSVTLAPFFQDIASEYKKAHLIITRAGASTITELAAVGRPPLFIPLSTSMDDHQTYNAQSIVNQKAGWYTSERGLTPKSLAHTLEKILKDPKGLEKTAERLHALGVTTADDALADTVEAVLLSRQS